MTGLVAGIAGLVVLSVLWVAVDSERYDWSRWAHPSHPEWHCAADSAGTWLVCCIGLWPVFFPGYLWDRKYAPRKIPVGE
jgi:hypothetical protein